ncbi:MAG: hypothetical protein ABSE54_08610 [Smithella sp.]
MKKVLITIFAAIIILSIGIGGMIGYDIHQDQQNTIITSAPVPAYADWEPCPTKEMKPIFTLSANTITNVKRIRYGKDYMALRVAGPKGEQGWVFYGSSFRIKKNT